MRAKAQAALHAHAAAHDIVQPGESAADDEQDVARVDLQKLLVRVLAAALRRNIGYRAFQDFQQRLLDALARHIPRDGRVGIGHARDFVDLVNIDDAAFGARDIAVSRLNQTQQDILHILAHIAGFGEGGGVGDNQRHIQDARQGLRQQGFAAASGTDQQDIALFQLDIGTRVGGLNALVVVVDRHAENTLGVALADDIFVQALGDLARRQLELEPVFASRFGFGGGFFFQQVVADFHAEIADEDWLGTGDEAINLFGGSGAEGALVANLRETHASLRLSNAGFPAALHRQAQSRRLPARTCRHRGRLRAQLPRRCCQCARRRCR